MIIVKNRELLIPGPERYIGTTYDTDSENRQFLLSRFAQNGVDLSALTFRLDLKYANDATDTVVLDKEVTDTNIILTWDIGSSVLQVPGTLFIQLRAVDDEVTVKWSSFHAALYVERHLNTPGTYSGSLTEIEQMEQDHQYMKGVVDELKSHLDYTHEAEAWAIGKKDGEDVPSTDETYHNNSKYYSEQAAASATAASGSATAAAGSATQAAATVADTNTRFNNAVAAVTVDTEVQDARVGADGTTYTVLKNRLDAEHTDVKSAISEVENGIARLDATWANGYITTGGNYLATKQYEIATPNNIMAPSDVRIAVKSGFRYNVYTFTNGSIDFRSGWRIDKIVLPKGTEFKMMIARVVEDTSEIADINTFLSKVTFENPLLANIDILSDFAQPTFSALQAMSLSVQDAIKNSGYYLKSDGTVVSTTSRISVSDRLPCIVGDTIKFNLSSGNGYLVFAVYNTNGVMTHYVSATGYANIISHTYTFVDGDTSYYLSGAEQYADRYSLEYGTVPPMVKSIDSRVGVLEQDSSVWLPSYWKTYLAALYPTLYAKDALIGNNGDSFVFITDVHYERNALKSPALIQNIVKNTAVKTVFNGGDTLDEGDAVAVALEKFSKWQSMMHGLHCFNIVGNHDSNNYDGSNPDDALTIGQYYGIMVKPAEQWINTDGNIYFCVDNESQKIRYVCLAIEAFASVAEGNPQRAWLQSKLTEKDSSWTIIVLQHRIWGSSTDAITERAQNVINAINEVYSNISATFIGIIAGHTHLDYYTTEPVNGYLLIACNCDTLSGGNSGYTRAIDTVSEQSFDVFYLDKTNKHLYAVRIGAGDTTVGGGTGIRDWAY